MDLLPFHPATPALAVLVSLLAAPLIAMSGRSPNLRETWTFAAAGAKFALVLSMAPWILAGNTHTWEICRILPGLSLSFTVDGFGMLFALVASSLWIVTTLYSIGYMRGLQEHAQTRFFVCFAVALSATIGVAFAGNLLTLYLFYEILSLSTWPLVTHHQDQEARSGGRTYLTYLLGSSIGLALPAMLITYSLAGSLEFSSLGILSAETGKPLLTLLLLMFLFGFAKGGLMPFHSWLPGAMVAPTPVSALLHAVAVVKVGVFSIVRVLTGIFGIDLLSHLSLNTVVCIVAGFTAVVSSLIALSQDNLKRRLAFSTVGQLSYIVLGAGLASKLGLMGSMIHIANHAFAKITLFFCAGAIYVACRKKKISEMDGLGRAMPYTFAAFAIASLSMIGVPPTAGFVSKWYLLLGSLEAQQLWVLAVLVVSTLLNAAYFVPIVYRAFFAAPASGAAHGEIREAPLAMVVPLLLTAVISVLLGIYPEMMMQFVRVFLG